MSTPWEDLSRLREGDLPPAEADALRARIAAEPELAAAWSRLQGLERDLRALPALRPPPELDLRAAGGGRRPARPIRWWWGVPAAAAVAVALLVAWPSPERPQVVLARGEQVVTGHADVVAAGLPVAIDGVATVVVEPAAGVARGTGAEGPMKVVGSGVGGVVVGALVTVWVASGQVVVEDAEGTPVVMTAGERRTFDAPAAGEAPRDGVPAGVAPGSPEHVAALEAELAGLRAEVQRLQFSETLARGQLASLQGRPIPWPTDVAEAYRPAPLEASLRALVAKHPGLSLEALDCSEFPCVAILQTDGPIEPWKDRLSTLPKELTGDDPADVMMMISQSDDGETSKGAVTLAIAPEDTLGDSEIGQRTKYRGETLAGEVLDE
jgi:ferric-dicitrate binding protein FerR (iron transport regulator)